MQDPSRKWDVVPRSEPDSPHVIILSEMTVSDILDPRPPSGLAQSVNMWNDPTLQTWSKIYKCFLQNTFCPHEILLRNTGNSSKRPLLPCLCQPDAGVFICSLGSWICAGYPGEKDGKEMRGGLSGSRLFKWNHLDCVIITALRPTRCCQGETWFSNFLPQILLLNCVWGTIQLPSSRLSLIVMIPALRRSHEMRWEVGDVYVYLSKFVLLVSEISCNKAGVEREERRVEKVTGSQTL